MKLSTLIAPANVHIGGTYAGIDPVIEDVAVHLGRGLGRDPEPIRQALIRREGQGGTRVTDGVIVPHAYMEAVEDIALVFIMPAGDPPIQYAGHPEPLRLVAGILASPDSAGLYLRVLKAVVELVQGWAERLYAARDAAGFVGVVQESGVEVLHTVRARDLVTTTPVVNESESIAGVFDIMKEHGWSHVPVVNGVGTLVGLVDFVDILASVFPDSVLRLNNLSFLADYEPIQMLLKTEAKGTASDYARLDPGQVVDADTSYVQVVFLMAKCRYPLLLVVDRGVFMGIITARDIIGKLARA